jgi:alkanesulfonate monooxygenase
LTARWWRSTRSIRITRHRISWRHGPRRRALAALTERIEIIAAIKPYLYHPVVLAKMALGIEHISRGRFAINLVNAWNRPELEKAGIGFAEHDERYTYGREWLSVVEPLMRGQTLNHRGANFQRRGLHAAPGRSVAAAAADLYRWRIGTGARSGRRDGRRMVHQRPADRGRRRVDRRRRRSPASGAPLRFGLSAFVIARRPRRRPRRIMMHLFALASKDIEIRMVQHANTDPKSVMAATMRRTPRVGSNGGTAAGLVGSYDQVAERIVAFNQAGIETFMLQYQPFEAEMRRFAHEVMPRVRAMVGVEERAAE